MTNLTADWWPYSDGIARVHGMANVQAEELVEYVTLKLQFPSEAGTP